MNCIVQLNLLVFTSGALLAFGAVDCGGKASTDPNQSNFNSGGYVGVGASAGTGGYAGNTSIGGNSTITIVGTRVPAIHRTQAQSCDGVNAPLEPTNLSASTQCSKHAECTDGVNGKCITGIGMMGRIASCTYDLCATDADCDPGKVCYCTASTAARCLMVGNCQIDSDWSSTGNSYCSPSMGSDCGGVHSVDSYYCHTAADTCLDNTDCDGSAYCNYSIYNGRWECTSINNSCAIG